MDLLELKSPTQARHPWELSRAQAVTDILRRYLRTRQVQQPKTLDYGCGDGFTGRQVQETFGGELIGYDPNLGPEQRAALSTPGTTMVSELPAGSQHDLVLLLDVVEHVEDDVGFLTDVTTSHLVDGGLVLITVPAFQVLFTAHDRFLKHFRRYSLTQIEGVVRAAGLGLVDSGYLFGSLLLPRALGKGKEALIPVKEEDAEGIGGWRGGAVLSRALVSTLNLDNRVMLALARFGLKVPGLSAWVLCQKAETS